MLNLQGELIASRPDLAATGHELGITGPATFPAMNDPPGSAGTRPSRPGRRSVPGVSLPPIPGRALVGLYGNSVDLVRGVSHDRGMGTESLGWSDSVEPAVWLAPRLSPFEAGVVTSVVPTGFPAYARILHPTTRGPKGDHLVRWARVAAWSGQPLDRLAHFPDIALPEQTPAGDPPWDSQGPTTGTLSADDAATLVDVLTEHTEVVDGVRRCWFCLWVGHGWDHAVYLLGSDAPAELRENPPSPPDPIPARVRQGVRVQLPHRDYFLFAGPVEDALAFVPGQQQTPSLWWPQDRSWCVATEIDLPWTYLGGSEELIAQVVGHPGLEALPALPDDPHFWRTPAWLQITLRTAVDELLSAGQTTVSTSVGFVRATLRVPTQQSPGELRIDYQSVLHGGGGTRGGIETPLRGDDLDRLAETVSFHLTHATLGLVNN